MFANKCYTKICVNHKMYLQRRQRLYLYLGLFGANVVVCLLLFYQVCLSMYPEMLKNVTSFFFVYIIMFTFAEPIRTD